MRFGKARIAAIPEGFTGVDIRIESSTCTGEKTIGFYSAADKKLHYAQFVRTQADIEDFYRQYGLKPEKIR